MSDTRILGPTTIYQPGGSKLVLGPRESNVAFKTHAISQNGIRSNMDMSKRVLAHAAYEATNSPTSTDSNISDKSYNFSNMTTPSITSSMPSGDTYGSSVYGRSDTQDTSPNPMGQDYKLHSFYRSLSNSKGKDKVTPEFEALTQKLNQCESERKRLQSIMNRKTTDIPSSVPNSNSNIGTTDPRLSNLERQLEAIGRKLAELQTNIEQKEIDNIQEESTDNDDSDKNSNAPGNVAQDLPTEEQIKENDEFVARMRQWRKDVGMEPSSEQTHYEEQLRRLEADVRDCDILLNTRTILSNQTIQKMHDDYVRLDKLANLNLKELRETQNNYDNCGKNLIDLQTRTRNLRNDIDRITRERDDLQKTADDHQANHTKCQNDCRENTKNLNATIRTLEARIEALLEEGTTVTSEKIRQKERADKLYQDWQECLNNNVACRAIVDKLTAEKQALEASINHRLQEHSNLVTELEACRTRIRLMQNQAHIYVEGEREKILDCIHDIFTQSVEITQLREELQGKAWTDEFCTRLKEIHRNALNKTCDQRIWEALRSVYPPQYVEGLRRRVQQQLELENQQNNDSRAVPIIRMLYNDHDVFQHLFNTMDGFRTVYQQGQINMEAILKRYAKEAVLACLTTKYAAQAQLWREDNNTNLCELLNIASQKAVWDCLETYILSEVRISKDDKEKLIGELHGAQQTSLACSNVVDFLKYFFDGVQNLETIRVLNAIDSYLVAGAAGEIYQQSNYDWRQVARVLFDALQSTRDERDRRQPSPSPSFVQSGSTQTMPANPNVTNSASAFARQRNTLPPSTSPQQQLSETITNQTQAGKAPSNAFGSPSYAQFPQSGPSGVSKNVTPEKQKTPNQSRKGKELDQPTGPSGSVVETTSSLNVNTANRDDEDMGVTGSSSTEQMDTDSPTNKRILSPISSVDGDGNYINPNKKLHKDTVDNCEDFINLLEDLKYEGYVYVNASQCPEPNICTSLYNKFVALKGTLPIQPEQKIILGALVYAFKCPRDLTPWIVVDPQNPPQEGADNPLTATQILQSRFILPDTFDLPHLYQSGTKLIERVAFRGWHSQKQNSFDIDRYVEPENTDMQVIYDLETDPSRKNATLKKWHLVRYVAFLFELKNHMNELIPAPEGTPAPALLYPRIGRALVASTLEPYTVLS